jgi:hypothetical protein
MFIPVHYFQLYYNLGKHFKSDPAIGDDDIIVFCIFYFTTRYVPIRNKKTPAIFERCNSCSCKTTTSINSPLINCEATIIVKALETPMQGIAFVAKYIIKAPKTPPISPRTKFISRIKTAPVIKLCKVAILGVTIFPNFAFILVSIAVKIPAKTA